MTRLLAFLCLATLAATPAPIDAQTRKPAVRRPATPAPTALRTEPAMMACPQVLGDGVQTKRIFCDVLTGRRAEDGVTIDLPPHTGDVVLTFDLHNRHTYSEELAKSNRGYRRYTASVGVFALDNTLLSLAAVESEFRRPSDLFDRVSGGTGPGGLKAVAPTGSEPIRVTIPAAEQGVSIVGEKLAEVRLDGADNFLASGRPIAIISNVMVHYRPATARAPARPRR